MADEEFKVVMQNMRKIVNPEVTSTWDDAWQAKMTPWDAGESQPPLREAIENSGIKWPYTGRGLVPGCGGGYDVLYLASALNFNVTGLDSSQTAVTKARNFLKDLKAPRKSEASFEVGDFFKYAPKSSDERFDVIYDYTFFVAIPPSRRNEWGKKMANLIQPGGHLITLVFPIDPPTEAGPPFFVRTEHYDEPLLGAFEKLLDKVPEISLESHIGRERLVIWKRKTE